MKHFYGYMVGYRAPSFTCQFKAYTKAQAKRALAYYRRYSNNALRPLHWSIQPITRKIYFLNSVDLHAKPCFLDIIGQ